jgi:hypothetical protein
MRPSGWYVGLYHNPLRDSTGSILRFVVSGIDSEVKIDDATFMNTTRKVGDKIVSRSKVFGDNKWVFSAWEPSSLMGNHHSIMSFKDESGKTLWYGQVTARRIPAEVEAMKGGSDERIAACDLHRAGLKKEAYDAIVQAFPEAATGEVDSLTGDITWSR